MNTLSRTQVLNELFDDQPRRGLQKPNGQLQPDLGVPDGEQGVPDGEQGRTESIKTQNTYSLALNAGPTTGATHRAHMPPHRS